MTAIVYNFINQRFFYTPVISNVKGSTFVPLKETAFYPVYFTKYVIVYSNSIPLKFFL